MNEAVLPIEQALVAATSDRFDVRARSPGFADEWLAHAERLCRAFGRPSEGTACADALFAHRLGSAQVAIAQVRGDAAAMHFRLMLLPRSAYERWVGDPFRIADRFPPHWEAIGPLETLAWPQESPPPRAVARLQQVLETGGSPTLLGAVQALVDGGRIVFERAAPAPQLVRDLWQLLPSSTQAELWPATFAFNDQLDFNVRIVPPSTALNMNRFLSEEQALDYPQGRYELNLQYAIEAGDQRELDRLLSRRSSKQMLKLAIMLLIGFMALAVAMGLLK